MRTQFAIVFLLLIVALGVCAAVARRSRRAIGGSVATTLLSLIPPVIGNLIIIASGNRLASTIGCYIYSWAWTWRCTGCCASRSTTATSSGRARG